MPFTNHYLRLQVQYPPYEHPNRFVRVYRPENESAATFEQDLGEVLYKAMLHALYTQEEKLFDAVVFGIADPENTLSAQFKEIMQKHGVHPDENILGLYIIKYPLSWELDPRLRTLQERLQTEISLTIPSDAYDPNELVVQHNTKALQQAIRDIFSVELDLSQHSLNHLDDIITMRQDDKKWRFHLFTEKFLTACGDYTGEVVRTIYPHARWTKNERPLSIGEATFNPRAKVIKLCCHGIRDSLETYVELLQYMMNSPFPPNM